MATDFLAVVAHQGGWDEFLFAAGPIALIGGLLWLANKRATALGSTRDTVDSDSLDRDTGGETHESASGETRD